TDPRGRLARLDRPRGPIRISARTRSRSGRVKRIFVIRCDQFLLNTRRPRETHSRSRRVEKTRPRFGVFLDAWRDTGTAGSRKPVRVARYRVGPLHISARFDAWIRPWFRGAARVRA